MTYKIFFFSLFITVQCVSQEKYYNSYDSLYIKDSVFHKVKDDHAFTGTVEFVKKNGNLNFKEEYQNGYLIRETEYYNKTKRVSIFKETYFYEHQFLKKKKEIRYHSGTGEMYLIKYFDTNQNLNHEEFYESGILVHSCEYKNGKKHGKEFCISKKGVAETFHYLNGKKVNKTNRS